MKEHNHASQKADKPCLRSSTQNILFCYLDSRCSFEANDQNHIHFCLIQVLKNGMALHFVTFRSPVQANQNSVYIPRDLAAESKNKRSSSRVKFNAWTSQRLLKSNPQVNHRTHLKDSSCLKFGKTSNRAVENLPQRKL